MLRCSVGFSISACDGVSTEDEATTFLSSDRDVSIHLDTFSISIMAKNNFNELHAFDLLIVQLNRAFLLREVSRDNLPAVIVPFIFRAE